MFDIAFFVRKRFCMKIYDVYKENKSRYKKYVILIKVGNFYETYGEDGYLLNNLFDYKVSDIGKVKRVGFPLIAYNKVISKLTTFKINYIVIEGSMTIKKKFNINNYGKYINSLDSINIRVDRICERIKVLKDAPQIEEILSRLEEII